MKHFKNLKLIEAVKNAYKSIKSQRKVAKLFKISKTTVYRYLNYKETEEKKVIKIREKKINKRTKRRITRYIKKNKYFTLLKVINDLQLNICKETLRIYLKSIGFLYTKIIKKPFLTKISIEKRLNFSLNTIYIPKLIDTLVFTDEKRFYLSGFKTQPMIWSKDNVGRVVKVNKNTEKISIMVWGSISMDGKGILRLCDKTLDSLEYLKIIKESYLPFYYNITKGNNMILVQDNAPCHKSKIVLDYFAENEIHYLDWPPHSPDLNPIENIWKFLSTKIYDKGKTFTSKKDLFENVLKAWNNLELDMVRKFVSSFNNRLEECIENKGGLTNY